MATLTFGRILWRRRLHSLVRSALMAALGPVGGLLPGNLKRRLARRHSRLGYLFLHDRGLVIHDYLGNLSVQIDVRSSTERAMLSDGYETDVLALLPKYVRPGDTVADVGANAGALSLALARQVGPTGRVHCFEPGPPFFERMRRNFQLNPQLDRIATLHNVGLSDTPGELFWAEDPKFPGNASLQDRRGTRVPVIALDTVVAEQKWERLDFLKIDVEGMEAAVLRGAEPTLRRFRPVMVVETLMEFETLRGRPVRRELLEVLDRCGYDLWDLSGTKRVTYPDLPANSLALPRERAPSSKT